MARNKIMKRVARVLLLTLTYQLVYPAAASALTSGPSQPEVQSFEPVGTTDMVDLFSGDFNYNIPLLDVDGYPINISYHSGVNIEQEASWVGLGWNINPGVVNRAVRGIPDDFNGDTIERIVHINPEKNVKVSAGGNWEFFGSGFNLSAGIYVNSNNYRGISVGMNTGANLSAFGFASAGLNMGIGSQNGADIDYDASLSYSTSNTMSREFAGGVGINGSGGYNTRNGVKDFTINVTANYRAQYNNKKVASGSGSIFSTTLPISLQNYVPVITNKSIMTGFAANVGFGGEFYGQYVHGHFGLMMSKLEYEADGSKKGFGYLYLQNARDEHIVDFTRDKDGMFNKTMQYLPPGNTTYDVYSASAQGTGGIFRPFRNDHGFVYDPKLESSSLNENVGVEIGLGNTFEVGANYQRFETEMMAGPWDQAKRPFLPKNINGSVFENTYFKQAGELTEVDSMHYVDIGGTAPLSITPDNLNAIPSIKTGSASQRDARGNVIYFLTNNEASRRDEASVQFAYSTWKIEDYTDPDGLKDGPNVSKTFIDRMNNSTRPKDRISEIVQVNKDGSRYIYGLPALNNIQKEVSFSIDGSSSSIDKQRGTTTYTSNEDGSSNPNGPEKYWSMNVTPSYAHSYLLTNVLSTDYVDVSSDGPTDDDLGTYVKFNYSRKEADYRWRVPYGTNVANHNPGYFCDKQDDKANYIIGSKEQWYLHSMETKNFVAEFYVSERDDAKGATDMILPYGSGYRHGGYSTEPYNDSISTPASSYKLDSIKLYNKHDRFLNQGNAVPVKRIFFEYDYSLCKGTPNSVAAGGNGKLTLKRIYMSYGRSDKNLLSPYKFTYDTANQVSYDIALKDRWGNYKPNNANTPNFEFPYVDQLQPSVNDAYASVWHLKQVNLPSGGILTVDYESDDYGFVQDKRAMEMFKVDGVGSSPKYFPNEYTLYEGKDNPYNYIYFTRRPADEYSNSLEDVYLNGEKIVYFNFGVDVASKGTYEAVRGYAEVEEIAECPGDPAHGYIKIKPRSPHGTTALLNPIVYTGLNMARYHLPHIFHPGSDPEVSDLENILKGLAASGKELMHWFENPILQFIRDKKARNYNKYRSFVRLCTPNLTKKGGGSRVKEIKISDRWQDMAGGDNATSVHGNRYEYKITSSYGTISSGVASYEPLVGGDENPFRKPANYYIGSKGSNFPPNDPMELLQEEPIGESLYPSPSVGYSKVKVSGIHKDIARSAQTEDEYEFYTARDFPIRVISTEIDKEEESTKSFFESKTHLKATQAYSIIMNDMHGKPKAISNYAIRKGQTTDYRELVTGQVFHYHRTGNKLNNNVKAFYRNGGQLLERTRTLGQEIDITVDSRQKLEKTHIVNVKGNLNTFIVVVYPIPFPTIFFPTNDHERSFKSLVSTKVVQEYGILKGVETIKDQAKTFAENVMYDAKTGDVLLTRIDNEFRDPQYQMTYPAHWVYPQMGPAYENVGVEDSVALVYLGNGLRTIITQHPSSYQVGDELFINTISPSLVAGKYYKAWVNSFNSNYPTIVGAYSPGIYNATAPTATNFIPTTNTTLRLQDTVRAYIKILRSAKRNMLTAPVQTTTSIDNPVPGGSLTFAPQKVINTKVTTYSDVLAALLPWHSSISSFSNTVITSDTNVFVFGYRGNVRVAQEYVYLANRDYSSAHSRRDGTFPISVRFWNNSTVNIVQNTLVNVPNINHYWKLARAVTKYNIWGNELENEDALRIPSAALFGFNFLHPVAVANNAKYYELLSEGFEDYRLLQKTFMSSGVPSYVFSPFKRLFAYSTPGVLSPSTLYHSFDSTATNMKLTREQAHTGSYSLKTTSGVATVDIPTAVSGGQLNAFRLSTSKKYIFSCWTRNTSGSSVPSVAVSQLNSSNATITSATITLTAKTNAIDGWTQLEGSFEVDGGAAKVRVSLPANYYFDDFRVFPAASNMKAFVYHPFNHKLIATLDENNFATFYEYDYEGQLVRINKETERGILTAQESRRANVKQ